MTTTVGNYNNNRTLIQARLKSQADWQKHNTEQKTPNKKQ